MSYHDISRADLELYIKWYNEDVIPGFERQAAKNRRFDKKTGEPRPNAFDDAIARSKKHCAELVQKLHELDANKNQREGLPIGQGKTEESEEAEE